MSVWGRPTNRAERGLRHAVIRGGSRPHCRTEAQVRHRLPRDNPAPRLRPAPTRARGAPSRASGSVNARCYVRTFNPERARMRLPQTATSCPLRPTVAGILLTASPRQAALDSLEMRPLIGCHGLSPNTRRGAGSRSAARHPRPCPSPYGRGSRSSPSGTRRPDRSWSTSGRWRRRRRRTR